MRFVADIHIHSRFARATSKELNPQNLHKWGALKGLTLVGTGDFTFPAWIAELRDQLEPAEEGLYRLKDEYRRAVEPEIYPSCEGPVRFVLSSEISLIYKKDDRTRKVHHLVVMPDFDAAERLSSELGKIGNIESDGRPILGMDSRDLVELCVEACEDVIFIPAHIWTPHFAVLGSSSGFECLEACYEDMLPHIFAVETGLSSDPPMNWRLSALDRFAIVSNSDAHSAQKLAREATCFDTELSYPGITDALKTRDPERFLGTLEFYPEEGKYHWDGHRKCGIQWKPKETLAAGGICPVCDKKLTVGVLHRVETLADREEDARPASARPYESLIPLAEVIGSAIGVGPNSKKVRGITERLLAELGPELTILRETPVEAIEALGEGLVAEGVRRMRTGEVEISAGYDGVYGEIRVFPKSGGRLVHGQETLFTMPKRRDPERGDGGAGVVADGSIAEDDQTSEEATGGDVASVESGETEPSGLADAIPESAAPVSILDGLDDRQREAVTAVAGPVVVVAGPGTGKTRVLTHRAAYLIRDMGIDPSSMLAVTFTNRAAEEMGSRVEALLPDSTDADGPMVGTFHGVALELLAELESEGQVEIVDEVEAREILADAVAEVGHGVRRAAAESAISQAKAAGLGPEDADCTVTLRMVYRAYQDRLDAFGVRDYDDILLELMRRLEADGDAPEFVRGRFAHLLVDEFQDVNAVQYRIVKALAGSGEGLFVIGDPDQSVYGFRGASPSYFGSLFEDFEGARRVTLETTYRSTRRIAYAASAVIRRNPDREPMRLTSAREEGAKCRLLSVPGETAEGIAVVREISRMVGGADMLESGGGTEAGIASGQERSFGDVGVLFRTGRQAEELETCFLREGLPYRVVGQKGFLESEVVRQALAFFRYALRPQGDLRLLNALALPPFHPGRATLAQLRRRAGHGALTAAQREDLPPAARSKVAALGESADRFRRLAEAVTPEELFHEWQDAFGLEGDADFERLVRVVSGIGSVERLLDTVLVGKEADCERAGRDGARTPEAVTLMTLHAAKGLEFPVVFICGVEDGLIPFRDRGADLAEERRLFYVGLTRARDEVVLTSARSRLQYGERIHPEVSPFVKDIPGNLITWEIVERERREKEEAQLTFL